MNQQKYWLALHHAPYIGPMKIKSILEVFNSPQDFFENLGEFTKSVKLNEKTRSALQTPDWERIEKELEWESRGTNKIITLDSSDYPSLLKEIADAPAVIYAHGNHSLLKAEQLAIVGSRNPSHSGRDNAHQFAKHLSNRGLTITSGLALGIDYESHRGALASQAPGTIAVVATGVDRVYPARHKKIAHEIVENNGVIISEYPLGIAPKKENFPRRNRIISGLSLGTLVIEAAQKSGSLITARLAAEQSRDVFAIPGSIQNPLAKGCHQLIREGAKLVETAEHILEELDQIRSVVNKSNNDDIQKIHADNLTPAYLKLLESVGFEPTTVDEIVQRSGLTIDSVSSMLLVLELQDYVISLPGSVYSRTQ